MAVFIQKSGANMFWCAGKENGGAGELTIKGAQYSFQKSCDLISPWLVYAF